MEVLFGVCFVVVVVVVIVDFVYPDVLDEDTIFP